MRLVHFSFLVILLSACGTRGRLASTEAPANAPQSPDDILRLAVAGVEDDVRYLASDKLMGRDTPSPGLELAAEYIAARFEEVGLKPVDSTGDYRQPVYLEEVPPRTDATFEVADLSFDGATNALVIQGGAIDLQDSILYLEYATQEELDAVAVKGRIVVANAGSPDATDPRAMVGETVAKRARVAAAGGRALVELYRSPQVPFKILRGYLGSTRMQLVGEGPKSNDLPTLYLDDASGELAAAMKTMPTQPATLRLGPPPTRAIAVSNVLGVIEGTDEAMRDEYVVITAHYDHVGTQLRPGATDSIFNGARDNAMGTATLLAAAQYFAVAPPRRSVLVLAVAAEEKGLLGSKYYAEHPLVPLAQTVFNLNMDGAGYDDKSAVSLIGYGRTSAQDMILESASAAGLTAKDDPVPEQGLFDRSDNVSFAAKGVPAVNVAPGITGFSEEVMKYYHQVGDDVESLDFEYVRRYAQTVVLAVKAIANADARPTWAEGDKYVEAAKLLYGADYPVVAP